MAVNKGITHKISQKLSTTDPSVPELKIFTKQIFRYRHFNRAQRVQRQRFQTGKNQQVRYQPGKKNINGIQPRLGITRYFQRRTNAVFSMTFAVLKPNQIVRIFNADPAIN
jgi:hypothetical protein